jgi:hypothetical protein
MKTKRHATTERMHLENMRTLLKYIFQEICGINYTNHISTNLWGGSYTSDSQCIVLQYIKVEGVYSIAHVQYHVTYISLWIIVPEYQNWPTTFLWISYSYFQKIHPTVRDSDAQSQTDAHSWPPYKSFCLLFKGLKMESDMIICASVLCYEHMKICMQSVSLFVCPFYN